jgi:hypothetical protein
MNYIRIFMYGGLGIGHNHIFKVLIIIKKELFFYKFINLQNILLKYVRWLAKIIF